VVVGPDREVAGGDAAPALQKLIAGRRQLLRAVFDGHLATIAQVEDEERDLAESTPSSSGAASAYVRSCQVSARTSNACGGTVLKSRMATPGRI
jgi:hypothetical protein